MTRPADHRWRDAAVCAQTDPTVFFPDQGSSVHAARICAACPVHAECLADALATRDLDFGVRAGTTPRQRRAMLRHQTMTTRTGGAA